MHICAGKAGNGSVIKFWTPDVPVRTLNPSNIRSLSVQPPNTDAPNAIRFTALTFWYIGATGEYSVVKDVLSNGVYAPLVAVNKQDKTTGAITATGLSSVRACASRSSCRHDDQLRRRHGRLSDHRRVRLVRSEDSAQSADRQYHAFIPDECRNGGHGYDSISTHAEDGRLRRHHKQRDRRVQRDVSDHRHRREYVHVRLRWRRVSGNRFSEL
jgi:hypothetical protein